MTCITSIWQLQRARKPLNDKLGGVCGRLPWRAGFNRLHRPACRPTEPSAQAVISLSKETAMQNLTITISTQSAEQSSPFFTYLFDNRPVRVVLINGDPWFAVLDVCNVLGYANSSKALKDHCKEKGVTVRYSLVASPKQSRLNRGCVTKCCQRFARRGHTQAHRHALPSLTPVTCAC